MHSPRAGEARRKRSLSGLLCCVGGFRLSVSELGGESAGTLSHGSKDVENHGSFLGGQEEEVSHCFLSDSPEPSSLVIEGLEPLPLSSGLKLLGPRAPADALAPSAA